MFSLFKRKKETAVPPPPDPETLTLYQLGHATPIAHITLNGYQIDQTNGPNQRGALCSFRVVRGNLWQAWHQQRPLLLQTAVGQQTPIKIMAMPTESNGYGLLEFTSPTA